MRFSLRRLTSKDDVSIIDYTVDAIHQAQETEGSGVGQGFEGEYLDAASRLTGFSLQQYSTATLDRLNKILEL